MLFDEAAENQDKVEVQTDGRLTACEVLRECASEAGVARLVSERREHGLQLLGGVEPRDLSRRQQAVDELEELRTLELVVFEDEHSLFILDTRLLHHLS